MDVILRHRVDRDYTVLTNKVLRDTRLSWGARGLLAYLLHLPSDFRLSVSYLDKQSPDGRHATSTRLKELQILGYVVIERHRDVAGCYTRAVWTVTDTPTRMPQSENPLVDNPPAENPTLGNPPLINTTDQQELTPTTTTSSKSLRRDAVVVGEELDFPPAFFGEHRASATVVIETCPNAFRQQILYEAAGIIERGKLRGSPIGLLRGLAKKAQQGAFVPSHGIAYGKKRRQERESHAQAAAESKSDPHASREVARKALATIRERIGGETGERL